MHKKSKRKLFKNVVSTTKLMPNLATISALFVGLTQVKFALQQEWKNVIIALFLAAILDVTDGRIARMFNVCSRFGAELDSLSDMVVFGACPAITIYIFSLSTIDKLGWVVAAFYAICISLRLARFNVCDIENITDSLSKNGYSVGLAAPAGAIFLVFPIILYNAFGFEILRNPFLCSIVALISGILSVSKIATPTIKKFHIKKENYVLFMLGVILVVGIIYIYTWHVISLFVPLYIFAIIASKSKVKKILSDSSKNDHTDSNK